jgi:hypothetical protein
MASEIMSDAPSHAKGPLTPAGILTAAAELLESPGAWTQGRWARNADDSGTLGNDPAAVCFCMLGAFQRVTHCAETAAWSAAELILSSMLRCEVPEWNDTEGRTQAEVVAALRAAAELAAKESV